MALLVLAGLHCVTQADGGSQEAVWWKGTGGCAARSEVSASELKYPFAWQID